MKLVLPLLVMLLNASICSAAPWESFVSSLTNQGYVLTNQSKTWLGRTVVTVTKGDIKRELVFERGSGQILQDLWIELNDTDDGETAVPTQEAPSPPEKEPPEKQEKPDRDGDRDQSDRVPGGKK